MAKLQFLRNQTPLDSKNAASLGLTNYVEKTGSTAVDGEIVLARYYTDSSKTTIKTMYGIVSVISGKKSIDIFEDVSILGDYLTKYDASQTYIEKDSQYLTINKESNTYKFTGIDGQNLGTVTLPAIPVYSMKTVTSGLKANVQTAYQLTKDGANVGDAIEIPKDSSLLGVGLTKGAVGNEPTFNEQTKTFTPKTSGTLNDVLAFAYSVADGQTWTTKVVVIDVADFLREAEFDETDFKKDTKTGKLQINYPTHEETFTGDAQLLYGYELRDGDLNMETQPAKADLIKIDTISDLDATNVQAALVKLNDKIEATSSAAIGIKAGNGISVTTDTIDSTLQNISVKIASGEKLSADGNGLHLTASCTAASATDYHTAQAVTSVEQTKGVVTYKKGDINAEHVKFVDADGAFSGVSTPETVENTLSYVYRRIKELSTTVDIIRTTASDGGYISDIEMKSDGTIQVTRVTPTKSSDSLGKTDITLLSTNMVVDFPLDYQGDTVWMEYDKTLNEALSFLYAKTQEIDAGFVTL